MIWHSCTKQELARSCAEAVDRLRAVNPQFTLRRFVHGTSWHSDPPAFSDDVSYEALLPLALDGRFLVFGTGSMQGPDIELGYTARAWELEERWTRYAPPEARTHRSRAWGGVTFNVHSKTAPADHAVRAFEIVVESLPRVVLGDWWSRAVRDYLRDAGLQIEQEEEPRSLLGHAGLSSVQYFGPELLAEDDFGARLAAISPRLGKVRRSGGGLWLRVREQPFATASAEYRAAFEDLRDRVPELFCIRRAGASRPHGPDALRTSWAVASGLLGRELASARYLQYSVSGVPTDLGAGPVELRFVGGAVAHTWPVGSSTAFKAGPFVEDAAVWSRPDGAEERLDGAPLQGAPVGERLLRVFVEANTEVPGPRAPSWELHFSGGSVLRVTNSSARGPAMLERDAPRAPRSPSAKGWAWWEVSEGATMPPGV